jgi:hypothetical protein
MPTQGGGPTDDLLQFFDALRRAVKGLYPSEEPDSIEIRLKGRPCPVTLPVPPAPPAAPPPAPPPFVPTDAQACLLEALEGRALKTTPLSEASGINRSQMFRHPGGLRELQDRGLVVNHPRLGFYRPDAPPEEIVTPSP